MWHAVVGCPAGARVLGRALQRAPWPRVRPPRPAALQAARSRALGGAEARPHGLRKAEPPRTQESRSAGRSRVAANTRQVASGAAGSRSQRRRRLCRSGSPPAERLRPPYKRVHRERRRDRPVEPDAIAFLPDGRMLIAQKSGVVRIVKSGALLPTPFIDLNTTPDIVNDYWDRGLLGIAVDPNFATNGYVYLLYTYENNADRLQRPQDRRAPGPLSPRPATRPRPRSEVVILGNAGRRHLRRLPGGRRLHRLRAPSRTRVGNAQVRARRHALRHHAATGPNFNVVDDRALRAQNLDSLAGKVLRITTDGPGPAGQPVLERQRRRQSLEGLGLRPAQPVPLQPAPGQRASRTSATSAGTPGRRSTSRPAGANLGWPCYEGPGRQSGYEPKPSARRSTARARRRVQGAARRLDTTDGQAASAATGGRLLHRHRLPGAVPGRLLLRRLRPRLHPLPQGRCATTLTRGRPTSAPASNGPVAIEMAPDGSLYYIADLHRRAPPDPLRRPPRRHRRPHADPLPERPDLDDRRPTAGARSRRTRATARMPAGDGLPITS